MSKKEENILVGEESKDSESNEESESGMEEEISLEKLEQEFHENPFSFEKFFKLYQLLKSSDDWIRLKDLLLLANKYIFLPELIWIEWIEYEISQVKTGEDKKLLLKLFEKALEDFEFFDVAKNYAKYAIKLFNEGLIRKNNVKIILEKLISKFCIDFNKGSTFFKKMIKLEKKLANPADEKLFHESKKTIRSLYHRQLKLPFADIDLTFQDYNEFESEENEKDKGNKIYEETYEKLSEILNLEEEFQNALDSKTLENLIVFLTSVKSKENTNDGNDKQKNMNFLVFYKRTIEEFPFEEEIWEAFLEKMEDEGKIDNQMLKHYERAAKCCWNNIEIIRKYLRLKSLNQEEENNNYENDFMMRLKCFNSIEDRFLLWEIFLENAVRKLNESAIFRSEDLKKINIVENPNSINKISIIKMRDAYAKAIDFFETHYKPDESLLYINQFFISWAKTETFVLANKVEMNKVMEKYIRLNGKDAMAWINYVNFEINFKNILSCRSLLKRACEYTKEGIEQILRYQLDFEKHYGDLQTLLNSENKLKTFLMSEIEIEIEEKEKEQEQSYEEKIKKPKKPRIPKHIKENAQENIPFQHKGKRKHLDLNEEGGETLEEEPKKKVKVGEKEERHEKKPIFKDSKNTVFVKNIPLSYSEEELTNIFPNKVDILECRLIKDKSGNPKGFAYIDFVSEDAAKESLIMNNEKVGNRNLFVSLSAPPKSKNNEEEMSLFLNNFSYSINEEKILNAVPDFKRNLSEIRIIKDINGKPKGFGYLVFDSSESMSTFYEKYFKNLEIDSRKIDISHIDSNKKLSQARNPTAFLKNLSFQVDENDLQQFFKDLSIKKIEIVKNQRGISRGFAYVDFGSLNDLNSALEMKKGVIHDREFLILKSDREITSKKESREEKKPSILNKKDAMEEKPPEIKEIEQKKPIPMKSNEDFRKMFLKK